MPGTESKLMYSARLLPIACGCLLLAAIARPVRAEWRGRIDLLGGLYPESDISEGRTRLVGRYDEWLGPSWYLKVGAYADGVVRDGGATGLVLRPDEIYLKGRGRQTDVQLGYSTVVWGLLEEIQPTDVINPLDLSRFILEGRAEARLPVFLTLVKLYLPGDWTIETVWVPYPRDRTFDQTDEASSPFRPAPPAELTGIALPESDEPRTLDNSEFGARLAGTFRQVDWGLAVYRDRVDNDVFVLAAPAAVPGSPSTVAPPPTGLDPASIDALLRADLPMRWMIGLEMETVIEPWILRAETAVFLDDPVQVLSPIRVADATTVQTGAGVSRRYDQTTVYLDGIYRAVHDDDDLAQDDEFSVVTGLAHRFHGGRREAQLFGTWNSQSESGFARAILSAEVRENLRAEAVGGLFWGNEQDLFGALDDADFLALRLKAYF